VISETMGAGMNAEISETLRARQLGLGMNIPKLLAQRRFVSAACHAQSNAHKEQCATPTLTPTNGPKLELLQF